MFKNITKWIREHYENIIHSIAFLPAIISILFLLLSGLMLELDFSSLGKQIKSDWEWLRLNDASTARTIVSTVAAGVLSLTVFSFSMVMILLNQAASQMSNRVLQSLIGNRFQQVILGFYIGTIVYSLFLLSTIRDIDSGIYIPALSIFLLIAFTITDIFLFIYFLHYVTQSVKYETIIEKIRGETAAQMKDEKRKENKINWQDGKLDMVIATPETGYFQGFDEKQLVSYLQAHDLQLKFLHSAGTFLLKGTRLLVIQGNGEIPEKVVESVMLAIDFYTGEAVNRNYQYGFRHLSEVGIRALSPGINDPSTAVKSLHAIASLLMDYKEQNICCTYSDSDGVGRVLCQHPAFDTLVETYLYPLWDYGKNDRFIQSAMQAIIKQMLATETASIALKKLLDNVESEQKKLNERH